MKFPDALASRSKKWGRIPGVYFLILNEEVVYIGSSVNAPSRIATHRSTKEFDSAFWITVREQSLLVYEGALIRYFAPPLNEGANPGYHGMDNEILRRLKLPLYENEAAAVTAYSAQFSARRSKQIRLTRSAQLRNSRRWARENAEELANRSREAEEARAAASMEGTL